MSAVSTAKGPRAFSGSPAARDDAFDLLAVNPEVYPGERVPPRRVQRAKPRMRVAHLGLEVGCGGGNGQQGVARLFVGSDDFCCHFGAGFDGGGACFALRRDAAAEARLANAQERAQAATEQVRQSARMEPQALGERLRADAVAIPADAQGVESHIANLERERDALGAVNLRADEEALARWASGCRPWEPSGPISPAPSLASAPALTN